MKESWIRRVLSLCLILFGGCVVTPADQTDLTSNTEVREFSGYIPGGGSATLEVREYVDNCHGKLACNCTMGAWRTIDTVTTGSSGSITDECGQTWHKYSKPVPLPNDPKLWCFSGLSRWYTQEWRLRAGSTVLASFNKDHNCTPSRACGKDFISECGNRDGIIQLRCGQHPPGTCATTFQ